MSLNELRDITSASRWREVAESLVVRGIPIPNAFAEFDIYWIEAGHGIREQVNDDPLLSRLLRLLLPQYQGKKVILYRGENLDRWQKGSVGFAWSESVETAEMFGRGLNAIKSGGLLLQALLKPEAIISGPNGHSAYLGENQFTVDPFLIKNIKVLKTYPPR